MDEAPIAGVLEFRARIRVIRFRAGEPSWESAFLTDDITTME